MVSVEDAISRTEVSPVDVNCSSIVPGLQPVIEKLRTVQAHAASSFFIIQTGPPMNHSFEHFPAWDVVPVRYFWCGLLNDFCHSAVSGIKSKISL